MSIPPVSPGARNTRLRPTRISGSQAILGPIGGLTIGIDARAATEEIAGGGRVVRELLRALAARHDPHRYVLYARSRWDEPLDERFTWALSPAPGPRWNVRAAREASRACDVLLSTNSYLTAWFTTIPTVLEVYDL